MSRMEEYNEITGYGKLNIADGNLLEVPNAVNYDKEEYVVLGKMEKVDVENGVEFGIVNCKKTRGYLVGRGWVGYKIVGDKFYYLAKDITTTTQASKWVREDLFNEEAPWRVLGTL